MYQSPEISQSMRQLSEATYTVKDIALLTNKSENLIYRRLTETPRKYQIRFARREGERWVFNKAQVDQAIASGQSIIIKSPCDSGLDKRAVLNYIYRQSKSVPCGKELAGG
jgi:hypothetical protein